MKDKNLQELKDPNSWNFEQGQRRPGIKPGGAVVSVAFSREEFEQVAAYAERMGMQRSEYIRRAAINSLAPQSGLLGPPAVAGSGGFAIFANALAATTEASGEARSLLGESERPAASG